MRETIGTSDQALSLRVRLLWLSHVLLLGYVSSVMLQLDRLGSCDDPDRNRITMVGSASAIAFDLLGPGSPGGLGGPDPDRSRNV